MTLILITGTPTEGFTFTGPFDDPDDAASYGDRYAEPEWWVVTLVAPKKEA